MTRIDKSSGIALAVGLTFIIFITAVIPYFYNANLEHTNIHNNFCQMLKGDLQHDKINKAIPPVVITQELSEYRYSCSS